MIGLRICAVIGFQRPSLQGNLEERRRHSGYANGIGTESRAMMVRPFHCARNTWLMLFGCGVMGPHRLLRLLRHDRLRDRSACENYRVALEAESDQTLLCHFAHSVFRPLMSETAVLNSAVRHQVNAATACFIDMDAADT